VRTGSHRVIYTIRAELLLVVAVTLDTGGTLRATTGRRLTSSRDDEAPVVTARDLS